jgi:predicted DNA-binding transcriptional regulator AlpA
MSSQITRQEDDKGLSERETADISGLSTRTLQRLRQDGAGPPHCTLGNRIIYLRSDVLAWMRSKRSQKAGAK